MEKQYYDLWHTKGGAVSRVLVYPVQQERTKRLGSITVFRDKWGTTYSSAHIKAWDALTPAQKIKAYRDAYQAARTDALWRIAKDQSLASEWENWKKQAQAERDAALNAITRGEPVPPPKRIWE